MAKHQNLSSPYAVHPFAFSSNADPANDGSIDMAPYKGWIDTGSSNTFKVRNAANTAWEDVSVAGASTTPAFGSNSASVTTYNDNGAGVLTARSTHHHIGVTSLAHTSNTFSGPVTLTASGQVGITSPSSGTFNINVAGSAGTGGGGLPAFHGTRVYNNANLSRNSGDFATFLTFNTERYDTDAYHDTSSNTDRITVPATLGGKYSIGATVEFASNATGIRYLYIMINGTVIAADTRAAVNGETTRISISTEVNAAVGDYFQCLAVQTSGGALNILSTAAYSPEFYASLIGV